MPALNIATPICKDESRLDGVPRAAATVFVIEGDQPVREVLEAVIELAGLRVESWESAESFLHGFDPPRRGCLLADVELSGMSGIDLALKLTRDRAPIFSPSAERTGRSVIAGPSLGSADDRQTLQ
jgi:DNA-binding NtrC family response regulator